MSHIILILDNLGLQLNYTGPKVHVTANNFKSAFEHHGSLLHGK